MSVVDKLPEVETDRGITFLNDSGDLEITWDEQQDAQMIEMIQKKMKEGVAFFIIEPRLGGIIKKKVKITKTAQLGNRSVKVSDKDVQKLFNSGVAQPARLSTKNHDTNNATHSRDAAKIASSRSIAVRPMQGG